MSKPIKPALSPEEWASPFVSSLTVESADECQADCAAVVTNRHGLAAACLHGQPYGFTHEDVARIRQLLRDSGWDEGGAAPIVDDLCARIEALLPPVGLTRTPYKP